MEGGSLDLSAKIVISGGAGLVGQNLVIRLEELGYSNLVVIDKHHDNLEVLRRRHPKLQVVADDLSRLGNWCEHFAEAVAVVTLHAQIGGNDTTEFYNNNVRSTDNVITTIKKYGVEHLVHLSSSVVESQAEDFYTNSKKEQERHVRESGIAAVILRPTLMFGWFDRKHLGWLSRFMRKTPVFPIPGDGRFMRQPLYVGDLCSIIVRCIEKRVAGETYDISGLEEVDYIDIIKAIRREIGARTLIVKLPYRFFWALLWLWGLFDNDPPFTTQQLEALVARDEFQVIDWPDIFDVTSTPFEEAISQTFSDSRYSAVALKF